MIFSFKKGEGNSEKYLIYQGDDDEILQICWGKDKEKEN